MSMAIDDGFWVGVGATALVVVAGLVTYKVLKKKRPQTIEKAKKSAQDLKKKTIDIARGAREAFREGYEGAKSKAAVESAEPAPAKA
ncbi:hypothetical protein ACFLQU_00205 [Verrucomicrobiota bacterium]